MSRAAEIADLLSLGTASTASFQCGEYRINSPVHLADDEITAIFSVHDVDNTESYTVIVRKT